MPRPAVTVIVPAHNRATTLTRCLASVQRQTWTDWELIVVDDGSTDHTADVVAGLHDDRITCVRLPRRRGAPVARNTGIARARGSLIAFLDSDDEWLPDKLSRQVHWFRTTRHSGLVYTGSLEVTEHHTWINQPRVAGRNLTYRDFQYSRAALCSTAMIPAADLARLGGFDQQLPALQDADWFLRASAAAPVHCIAEPLAVIHQERHTNRIGSDGRAQVQACRRFHAKHRRQLRAWGQTDALLDRSGWAHFALLGDARTARKMFAAAARHRPLQVRAYLRLAMTLTPPTVARWLTNRIFKPAVRRLQISPRHPAVEMDLRRLVHSGVHHRREQFL